MDIFWHELHSRLFQGLDVLQAVIKGIDSFTSNNIGYNVKSYLPQESVILIIMVYINTLYDPIPLLMDNVVFRFNMYCRDPP